MWPIEPMQVTPGGPYTHEDQYETGAARTAARPFLYKKKIFLKLSNDSFFSDLYECPLFHLVLNDNRSVKKDFTG